MTTPTAAFGAASVMRALVQKAFTPSSVADFTPQIQRIIKQQIAKIDSDPFDVVTTLSKPIPTIVIAEYIGVNSEDHQRFKQW